MEKRKLILRNFLSPGDLVMLTAAVRDLHHCHPGCFLTDVRTSCPELWEHNPHLTRLRETDDDVEQIDCQYPLIDRSNEAPYHCIHGFSDFLSTKLGLDIQPTRFAGDIHLSREEQHWKSTVHELAGRDLPFWIVNAGGKFDFTIKWWDSERYQQVVDHFRGRMLFVQVGEIGHHHPPLKNVVDLRGRTDLRQLVRLVYHAQGVLCGVTALMHLSAAVPTRPDRPRLRAAVIIAGGREPTHWEAYPHHQFIHTIGALPCCATGGCWRARTQRLGDGEKHDERPSICSNVAGYLPRCMDMITVTEVIRRIEMYFQAGSHRFLNAAEARPAMRAVNRSQQGPRFDTTINLLTAPGALKQAAQEARRSSRPEMDGCGVLLYAASSDDLRNVIASARAVRVLDAQLPIECWMQISLPRTVAERFRSLRITLRKVPRPHRGTPPFTRSEIRARALVESALRNAIVLEPGVALRSLPSELLRHRAFQRDGALFYPDRSFQGRPGIWKLCRLRLPAVTAGTACFVIDRMRCWSSIMLWRWILEHAYFFKGYVDGDGGAAQLAFARLKKPLPLRLSLGTFSVCHFGNERNLKCPPLS